MKKYLITEPHALLTNRVVGMKRRVRVRVINFQLVVQGETYRVSV